MVRDFPTAPISEEPGRRIVMVLRWTATATPISPGHRVKRLPGDGRRISNRQCRRSGICHQDKPSGTGSSTPRILEEPEQIQGMVLRWTATATPISPGLRVSDFPVTAGVFQTANAGGSDVFVTKMNSNVPILSTPHTRGYRRCEQGSGIAVDGSGACWWLRYPPTSRLTALFSRPMGM